MTSKENKQGLFDSLGRASVMGLHMVSGIIDEKLDQLGDVYYLASYADRKEVVAELNDYYRSLGVSEENLIDVGDKRQQPDSALLPAAK